MAVGAFASTSGNIGIDTGQNVSFHGRYTYGVAHRGWAGKAVRVTGTLASTGSNSGHVNVRQQGYSWRRIGHVNIGGKVGVNSDVSPEILCVRQIFGSRCAPNIGIVTTVSKDCTASNDRALAPMDRIPDG